MMTMTITIAKQFSEFPAGRHESDGPYSGEKFRKEILVPALRTTNGVINIDMDGTAGYGSSFLDEAFGGLVREEGFLEPDLRKRLKIVSSMQFYIDRVWEYISKSPKKKA